MTDNDASYEVLHDDEYRRLASEQSEGSAAGSSIERSTETSSSTKVASALLISASDKAGMAGIDRERINAILLRDSGNSTFMQRQRKLDENTNKRIQEMRRQLEDKDKGAAANEWRRELKRSTIEPLLQKFRSQRCPISTCVVIDMDGFFISCHILDHPRLAHVPACVGSTSMISTSNYEARKYGVRAAMPGYLGSTLVKELSGGKEKLTFVKSDFALYKRKSLEVRAVLEEYDPNLKMYSLDEAYMDIGPYLEIQLLNETHEPTHEDIRKILSEKSNLSAGQPSEESEDRAENQSARKQIHEKFPLAAIHASAQSLLHSIRKKVKDATGLTCSAGLSSNFLLAKIASDMNKPDGQHFVGPSEAQISEFINPLPVRKVNGIGRVMEKTLSGACGIETVKDLYDKRAEVYFLFKLASAQFLMRASIGYAEGKRHESSEEEGGDSEESLHRKGISHERTFSPTSSWSDMCTRLERICLSLVQDLRERSMRPKTITLKVKLANFNILTKATTRGVALFQNCNYRQSSKDLVDIVINLLKEAKREQAISDITDKGKKTAESSNNGTHFSVRLLGVRCSNFQLEKDTQLSLDCYRPVGSRDNMNKTVNAPQITSLKNEISHGNTSPMVKNPYISPKATSSKENISCNGAKSISLSSKRALYTPPPTGPNTGSPITCTGTTVSSADDYLRVDDCSQIIRCPLCRKGFQADKRGNAKLNAHVDACLNTTAVKRLVDEETRCAEERTKKKRQRLTDFFCS